MNTADRFKFRVWCDFEHGYIEGPLVNGKTGKVCGTGDYIIEPCTGWLDKNNTLIYEGDIVLVSDLGVGLSPLQWVVVWSPFNGCFTLKRADGVNDDLPMCETLFAKYSKIVGNIHQYDPSDLSVPSVQSVLSVPPEVKDA